MIFMHKYIKIAVVGGGASGMMAAICAMQKNTNVTIYEGSERLGKKILSTGNGKCNFSHRDITMPDYYGRHETWLKSAINRFDSEDTVAFFTQLGMLSKAKNGYLYPLSEQASTVLDVLRNKIEHSNITVMTGTKVIDVIKTSKGTFSVLSANSKIEYDKVIIACGGKAAPKTGSDGNGYSLAQKLGHQLTQIVPGLVQLICKEDYFKSISGVRSEGIICISTNKGKLLKEYGEIQFTDYGVSGIPVFQLSRSVNYLLLAQKEVIMELDLLPDYSEKDLEILLLQRRTNNPNTILEEFFTGILNKKLMLLFIKLAGLKPSQQVNNVRKEKLLQVLMFCKQWRIHIIGNKGFDNAQVCAGGIEISQITEYMESKIHAGLYFTGEILDIDGRCGGYNLQWAWTSGYIAGTHAAKE